MKIIADLHTHTIASGHAYSTVNELAQAACERGLRGLALTDHGPALPGGPHPFHFYAMRFIPRVIAGVRIFRGIEANVMSVHGDLDLEPGRLAELDFVMAGLHEDCGFRPGNADSNTRTLLRVMENPLVRCISHPGNPVFPLNYRELVRGAARSATAVEINNSSLGLSRKGSCGNCLEIARLCAELGAPVMVGSDAHIAQMVGVFDDALELLEQAGVREEQVVNANWERLLRFLNLPEQ